MSQYVILTNRKRAIIALIHTVAFLGLAVLTVNALRSGSPASAWIMATVYVLVSVVLLVLTFFSGAARERIYFSLCAASAGFGWRGNWSAMDRCMWQSTRGFCC